MELQRLGHILLVVLQQDITVIVIHHGIDGDTVRLLGQKLTKSIVVVLCGSSPVSFSNNFYIIILLYYFQVKLSIYKNSALELSSAEKLAAL